MTMKTVIRALIPVHPALLVAVEQTFEERLKVVDVGYDVITVKTPVVTTRIVGFVILGA